MYQAIGWTGRYRLLMTTPRRRLQGQTALLKTLQGPLGEAANGILHHSCVEKNDRLSQMRSRLANPYSFKARDRRFGPPFSTAAFRAAHSEHFSFSATWTHV